MSSTNSTDRAPAPLPIMLGMLETSRHRPSTQAMALPEMYAGIEDAAIVDEKRITMAMWLLGGGITDAGGGLWLIRQNYHGGGAATAGGMRVDMDMSSVCNVLMWNLSSSRRKQACPCSTQ